jgi:hypothetical protein
VQILPGQEHGLRAIADHAGKQCLATAHASAGFARLTKKSAFPAYTPNFVLFYEVAAIR